MPPETHEDWVANAQEKVMIPAEGTAVAKINVGTAAATATQVDAVELYLELMKRCLTNTLYDAPDLVPLAPRSAVKRVVLSAFRSCGITLARSRPLAVLEHRVQWVEVLAEPEQPGLGLV